MFLVELCAGGFLRKHRSSAIVIGMFPALLKYELFESWFSCRTGMHTNKLSNTTGTSFSHVRRPCEASELTAVSCGMKSQCHSSNSTLTNRSESLQVKIIKTHWDNIRLRSPLSHQRILIILVLPEGESVHKKLRVFLSSSSTPISSSDDSILFCHLDSAWNFDNFSLWVVAFYCEKILPK